MIRVMRAMMINQYDNDDNVDDDGGGGYRKVFKWQYVYDDDSNHGPAFWTFLLRYIYSRTNTLVYMNSLINI